MTEPASLTPVGDHLRSYGPGVGYGCVGTHMPGCATWHPWCAYAAGRAEALRQLAADLEAEASAISGHAEPPWAAMYGLKVTSAAEAAVILRRAAELALRRADGQPQTPAAAGAPAPQPPGSGGDNAIPEPQ